jgi:hypothetical protein
MRRRLFVLCASYWIAYLFPILFACSVVHAQTDNTIYVRNFQGSTVGAKVTAAMATCGPSTQVPCILVIDPSLAAWATGTLPTLCSHCYLWDFRTGPPSGGANQLHGDVAAGPGEGNLLARTQGIEGTPFCSGFTPANGQVLQLTTASSPSPCWTAATPTSSGVTAINGAAGSFTFSGSGVSCSSTACTFAGSSSGPTNQMTLYALNGYNAFGDSITLCGASTAPSPFTNILAIGQIPTCYVGMIGKSLGIPYALVNNYGTGYSESCDQPQTNIFPNVSPAPAPSGTTFSSLLIGTNDAYHGFPIQDTAPCHLAAVSWLAVSSQYKVMGSTATTTGTCTNDTTFSPKVVGEKCTASGSTMTFSVTTYGGPIYIWPRMISSDTGRWTYQVDSGTPVTVSTAPPVNFTTINGATQSVQLIRITGVSAGTHTLKLTQTAAGTMAVVAVGSPPYVPQNTSNSTAFDNQPPVLVMQIPNQYNGNNQSTVNAYRAVILADYNTLLSDNLNLAWAPVDQTVPNNAIVGDNADTLVHPNFYGNVELAEAALANIHISNLQQTATYLTPEVDEISASGSTFQPVSCLPGTTSASGAVLVINQAYTTGIVLPAMQTGCVLNLVTIGGSATMKLPITPASGVQFDSTVPPYMISNSTLCLVATNYPTGSTPVNWTACSNGVYAAPNMLTALQSGSATVTLGAFNLWVGNGTASIPLGTVTQTNLYTCIFSQNGTVNITYPTGGSLGPASLPPQSGACFLEQQGLSSWFAVASWGIPPTSIEPLVASYTGTTVTISYPGTYNAEAGGSWTVSNGIPSFCINAGATLALSGSGISTTFQGGGAGCWTWNGSSYTPFGPIVTGSNIAMGTQNLAVSGSGCTLSGEAGGATAGQFSLSAGACSVTVNLPTAPHSWECISISSGGAVAGSTNLTASSAEFTIDNEGSTSWQYFCAGY